VRYPPRVMAIVRSRVPSRHIEEVVLGAGLFDPKTALRLGLVDEIIADDVSAKQVARARLAKLAAHPAEGYALAKFDLRGDEQTMCPDAIEQKRLADAVSVWTSEDVKKKILSVLAR
jgi:enoyl-CoA hydratase/carnithine racemase